MKQIKAYFDGSCRVNIASWGYHIGDPYFIENCGVLHGGVTSNVAEYTALLMLLKELKQLNIKNVLIHGDNQMVIRIINKKYGVKRGVWSPHDKFPDLKDLAIQCEELFSEGCHEAIHIKREHNTTADSIAESAYNKSDVEYKNIPYRKDVQMDEYQRKQDKRIDDFKNFMNKEHGIMLTDYDVMMIKNNI